MQPPIAAVRQPLVAHAAHVIVRGALELRGTRRLMDVLNQQEPALVALRDAEMLPAGGTQWTGTQPVVYVNKDELLVAYPADSAADPYADAPFRQSYTSVVQVCVGACLVRGTIGLPEQVRWEEYLSTGRERFLVLRDATIWSAAGGEPLATAPYAAVNRRRLSVWYEP